MMDDDDADLDFSQERKVDFTKNLGSVFFLSQELMSCGLERVV